MDPAPFPARPAPPRKGLVGLCLLLSACNILNPTGSGEYPDKPDVHIELGQRALQDQDFARAKEEFSRAIAQDSSKSKAYQGLAKAELGADTFEISALVRLADSIRTATDDRKIAILANQSTQWFNHVYRPLLRVARYYSILSRRDSLGLTDGLFPSRLVRTELSTILNNQSYFLLIDLPDPATHLRDTVISQKELETLRLMTIGSGGLTFSTGQVRTTTYQGHTIMDTAQAAGINNLLLNVDAIKDDSVLMSQLKGVAKSNGADPTADVAEQARQFLDDLGSSTSFFLINDSLDNDGDGCVNEETGGDGVDDDGDGLVDEDSHVFWFPPLKLALDASGRLKAVAPARGDSSWIDTTGKVHGLKWVSVLDSGNATVFDSISRVPANSGKSPEEIREATRLEIRRRVLAMPADRSRVILGRKTVGGCWDHVQ